jgi:hypothetical protein
MEHSDLKYLATMAVFEAHVDVTLQDTISDIPRRDGRWRPGKILSVALDSLDGVHDYSRACFCSIDKRMQDRGGCTE